MKKLFLFLSFVAFGRTQAQTITTIAGTCGSTTGYTGDGGSATAATLAQPFGVAKDASGNIYIGDAQNNRIRMVNTSGIISTVVGNGAYGWGGDGGPATAANLKFPCGIAFDGAGNMYIADQENSCIRMVNTSGIISTVAGLGYAAYTGDGGPATAAALNYPIDIAVDGAGNIFIADRNNFCIRKINSSGIISTFAGTGTTSYSGDGGAATAAGISDACGVAVDGSGNVYIADSHNNCIRKVNSSGIITTIAGTGSAGFSGDGGPATAAMLNFPFGITLDVTGNMYVSDYLGQRIRKIDYSSIITTIAGNGTFGSGGDGGPATAAQMGGPTHIWASASGNLLMGDHANNAVRKIQFIPTYIADSFNIYFYKLCSGPQIVINPNHYTAGMYVKSWFSDGTTDSTAVSVSGAAIINHTYSTGGTYMIKHLLYSGSTIIDSFQFTYSHTLCNSFPVNFYFDVNSNCIKDTGEEAAALPAIVEVDSNGVAIDTLSAISGFFYSAYGSAGDVYAFKVLTPPSGLHITCPSTAIIYDTMGAGTFTAPAKNMGMECTTSSGFDLSVHSVIPITGTTNQHGDIYVQNAYCTPTTGTITLHHSTRYPGTPAYITPAPASITTNTIVWNISSLSSTLFAPVPIHYLINIAGTSLTPGDTVHSYITIDPQAGDADTTNNTEEFIDTVRAGYDPNEMSVKPAGCIAYTPYSTTPTQLQYTINFENTGNDTAHNIYVLDTLSDDVDASSMRLVMASHKMYTSRIKDAAGHNILKFEFPKINLLDSSHHNQCDGAVIFNINIKSGLAIGTTVYNRAGIYFDINSVVMTNKVYDLLDVNGCLPDRVNNLQPVPIAIGIYPNPATDELTIKADKEVFQSFTITNSIGSMLRSNAIIGTQTQVNIKTLPAGLYYVVLKGEQGNVVRKFVKW